MLGSNWTSLWHREDVDEIGISRGAQGWVGWVPEQPHLVSGSFAHGKGLELDDLQGPFEPKQFQDSMLYSSKQSCHLFHAVL